MPRIGITGHTNLTSDTVPLVAEEIRRTLTKYQGPDLVGVTCLAKGADQAFAHVVLDLAGRIEVVPPAANYRNSKVKPDNAVEFDELISKASQVHVMPYSHSNREAYMAASANISCPMSRR